MKSQSMPNTALNQTVCKRRFAPLAAVRLATR